MVMTFKARCCKREKQEQQYEYKLLTRKQMFYRLAISTHFYDSKVDFMQIHAVNAQVILRTSTNIL